MPFTEKAPAFLFENYTRNDKEWFQSNKGTYQKALVEPFTELIEYLSPLMGKIDPEIICTPKKYPDCIVTPAMQRESQYSGKAYGALCAAEKSVLSASLNFISISAPTVSAGAAAIIRLPQR